MSSSWREYWRLPGLPARQTQDEKRHDEAVADAKRAIQLAPGSADAAELASYVPAASGHPEEAAVPDVSYWPIVFSNSGSGCQALYGDPCRAHCSLRGRGAPSA